MTTYDTSQPTSAGEWRKNPDGTWFLVPHFPPGQIGGSGKGNSSGGDDEVSIGPMTPANGVEIWIDTDEPDPIGVVEGTKEEVTVGPTEPTNQTDLWVDTDEPDPVALDDVIASLTARVESLERRFL